jgi:hypothetical protein
MKEDSMQEQGVIDDGLNNLAMIALYNAFQAPLLCSFGANTRIYYNYNLSGKER